MHFIRVRNQRALSLEFLFRSATCRLHNNVPGLHVAYTSHTDDSLQFYRITCPQERGATWSFFQWCVAATSPRLVSNFISVDQRSWQYSCLRLYASIWQTAVSTQGAKWKKSTSAKPSFRRDLPSRRNKDRIDRNQLEASLF